MHELRSPLPWLVAGLLLILAWDASGGDLWLARQAAGTDGFPLRDNFWLTTVLHRGGRTAAGLLWLAMILAAWRPPPFMRGLGRGERWQLVIGVLCAVLAVDLVKYFSSTSCPWSLREFGGLASHVSHWRWGVTDGGSGRCFPAGHASAGFAFMAAWFVWRRHAPRAATLWLVIALLTGLTFGIAQQLRGAHFLSHTLWTAWICGATGWAVDALFRTARCRPL
ncbi:MAG: phosphatase PAP2 family protein [Gammaproteobacteria bacterium]|nr:phosphatase PAP2 family protein [Gammaproteobacteria bacterium]